MVNSGHWDSSGIPRHENYQEVVEQNIPEKVDEEDNQCPICLDPMSEEEETTVDCCLKNFHTVCLRQWKLISQRCPTCNMGT